MKEDEVKSMIAVRLADARNVLREAEVLLPLEWCTKGIVNRSYYAMFYAALALLQLVGKTPSKHKGVLSLFDSEFVHKGLFSKDCSSYFHLIFELRNDIDYGHPSPLSREKLKVVFD